MSDDVLTREAWERFKQTFTEGGHQAPHYYGRDSADAFARLQDLADLERQGLTRTRAGMIVPLPPPPPPAPELELRALLRDETAWQAYLAQWDGVPGDHVGEPFEYPCVVVSTGMLEFRDLDGEVDERTCWHDFFTIADARELLELGGGEE